MESQESELGGTANLAELAQNRRSAWDEECSGVTGAGRPPVPPGAKAEADFPGQAKQRSDRAVCEAALCALRPWGSGAEQEGEQTRPAGGRGSGVLWERFARLYDCG